MKNSSSFVVLFVMWWGRNGGFLLMVLGLILILICSLKMIFGFDLESNVF